MHQYLDISCETLSPYQLMNGHPVYDFFSGTNGTATLGLSVGQRASVLTCTMFMYPSSSLMS